MKIVFLLVGAEGRPKILNGDTIRHGKAPASGTDQSVIMVAEYLASKGNDVTVVVYKTDGQTVRGVKYTDFEYSGLIGEEVDILVSALWFDKYSEIPFKVTKGLIYWYHMAWVYCIDEMVEFSNLHNIKLGFVNVSKWAQGQNEWSIKLGQERVERTVSTIIPNPIMTDLIDSIMEEKKIEKTPRSSIFHAQFSRGGAIAQRTVKELGWEDMYHFDYVDPANGVDKEVLFEKLLETDYFIFPLYHPGGCVYKDTFSCAVAEAVAAGVIVITYPLGALPEYFSDGCVFLNFPYGTDMERMMAEKVTCEAEYMDYHKNFVDKLTELEDNPELKNAIREKSKNLIKNNFSIDVVGNMWLNLINEF
jgi:glycosyltransferase involved in cell wall biosynthesis